MESLVIAEELLLDTEGVEWVAPVVVELAVLWPEAEGLVLVELAVMEEEEEILDGTLVIAVLTWLVAEAVLDIDVEELEVIDEALSVEVEFEVVAVVEIDTVIVGCQYGTEVLVLVLGGSASTGNVMLVMYESPLSASTKRLPRSSSSSVLRMLSMASVAAVLLLAR